MIPERTKAEFSVDDFVESLRNLDSTKQAESEGRLPFSVARKLGTFVRADLGVFRNTDDGSIWHLQQGDDGVEYIIRSENFAVQEASDWTATVSRTGESVTLAYQNYPVKRFAGTEFNFSKEDSYQFADYLVKRAAEEQENFAKRMLTTLPFEQRIALQKKFRLFRES